MAGSNSQKELLTLIRDVSSEKSQGGTSFNLNYHHLISKLDPSRFLWSHFSNKLIRFRKSIERRVVNLKRQIEELQSELDSVNAEVEDAKRLKECTEQELKGFEVELAMNESSIQTLEV